MKLKITKKDFENLSNEKTDVEQSDREDAKEEMKKKIQEYDDEYENISGWTYGGVTIPKEERRTFEMPSDDVINDKAKSEISPLYEAKRQSESHKNQVEKQKLADSSDELIKKAQASLSAVRSNFKTAKDDASNKAMKKGLARSSIIEEQLKNLKTGESNAIAGVYSDRDKGLKEIQDKILNADKSYENALKVLQEQEDKETSERVEDIFEGYDKERKEVEEFNNDLRRQEQLLRTYLLAAGVDSREENSEEYIKMQSGKMQTLYEYYYDLGEDALSEILKDKHYIREHLGEDGYKLLRSYFE